MTPPEKLRAELERLRCRGYAFRQAWPGALNAALRDEPVRRAHSRAHGRAARL